MTDSPANSRLLMERVAWLLYWLAFVVMTVRAGFDPGFVRNAADLRPYPWLGVTWNTALLGTVTFGLWRILSLGTVGWSWSRWGVASILAFMFAAFEVATVATDLPGYMYVAPVYALVTLVGLMTAAVITLLAAAVRRLGGRLRAAA
jgi:hypothetical protein